MESTILVIIILASVAAAAFFYTPPVFLGQWSKLGESFEVNRQAPMVNFKEETLLVGRTGFFWFLRPAKNDMPEYAKFDAALNDEGLWLLYEGPAPQKCPPVILIPWQKIDFLRQKGVMYDFRIDAVAPVDITVTREFGDAMMRRSGR